MLPFFDLAVMSLLSAMPFRMGWLPVSFCFGPSNADFSEVLPKICLLMAFLADLLVLRFKMGSFKADLVATFAAERLAANLTSLLVYVDIS